MKICEIIPAKPTKPKSAMELQIDAAKKRADNAADQLKLAQQRKRMQRTQKAMSKLHGMGY
jgi:hypothetical protein